jgi:hypothetical protein
MMEQQITYFGQQVTVACDEKCNKAWGINKRPQNQLSDDPDDYEYLSDDELGEAPVHPGTWEGSDKKPVNKAGIPNRWCVRECERCGKFEVGESITLKDFSQRIRNIDI